MRVIDYMDGMTPRVLIKRHVMGVLRSMTPRKAVNAAVFMAQRSYKPLRPVNKPLFLKIEPTNCCDLKCPGCGTHHPRAKGFMKMETFRDLLAVFGRWCVRISLYGEGEPLLHPQIFEMVETAEKARCPVSISSNFNSLDTEKIEKLLDSGLEHVIVCIDGASRETHCMYRVDSDYDRILRNLGELAARKRKRGLSRPVVEVQTIRFPHNSAEIPEISRLVAGLGADLHSIRGDNRDEDAKRCTLQECPYPWGSLTVSWDGRIFPCENFCNPLPREQLTVVDLHNGADVWNSPWMIEARSVIRGEKREGLPRDYPCIQCHHFVPDRRQEPAGLAAE